VAGPGKRPRKYRSPARRSPALATAARNLGAKVRALRLERDLTQEELADRSRLDGKHVQAIELAATNPTLATLVGLARGLGVRVADLFDDE